MERWLGELPVDLVAEHGLFIREVGKQWKIIKPVRKVWKKKIRPFLDHYRQKLPGSIIEEKEYALAFHYRNSDANLAHLRVTELAHLLMSYTTNMGLQLMHGKKVLEIRSTGIDKGVAAMRWLGGNPKGRFIFAAGDDVTDEDLFKAMPKDAITIKVGIVPSAAQFNLSTSGDLISLLRDMYNAAAIR